MSPYIGAGDGEVLLQIITTLKTAHSLKDVCPLCIE